MSRRNVLQYSQKKNERSNLLIFFHTRREFGREVLIIGTSVYSENLAQYLNAMLEAERMHGVSSLFECGVNMAIAFLGFSFPLLIGHCVFEVP